MATRVVKTVPETAVHNRWYLEVKMEDKRKIPAWQAYKILHIGFVLAPLIAGVDKFFHYLTNWTQYLAPQVTNVTGLSPGRFMQIVGGIEILAAIVVLVKPKIGGYVVAAWLAGIIVNLLMIPGYYDVALRDFGLMLGALALARLARHFDY
jgi:hypothetical protein